MKTPHLPKTDSIQELAHFWDKHDLTDFEEELEEVTEPVFEPPTVISSMAKFQISRARISIYLKDFMQSREFADYVLQRNLPSKKSPKLGLIHLAFNTSLVVSYSRPFTGNKNPEGKTVSSPLKELVREVLNEEERKVHNRVVGSRHSTYAHSDDRVHVISGSSNRSGFPYLMADPFYARLTEAETAMLRTMSGKWIKYLQKAKQDSKA